MIKLIIGLLLMIGGILGGFLAKDGWSDIQSRSKNDASLADEEQKTADVSKTDDQIELGASAIRADDKTNNQGLSYEGVLETLADDSISDLHIQNFVKRTKGRRVTWKVLVASIKPAFERDETSDIYLVFRQLNSEKLIPDVAVARFPREKELELMSLQEGDTVVIEGDVTFSHLSSWSVGLENPELLRFNRKK